MIIYTDGSCRGNPGPGGYGIVITNRGKRKELSGGFRRTTNNRMELMACIVALETLKKPERIVLHSDSSYVVNGISKGWAKKWQANNWRRTSSEQAANADLWERLLRLCERHQVKIIWVRGHAGNPGNTRCDELALRAASGDNLAVDAGFEDESG
ncbi:MAG: ribonuclease H [delta proteobacterium MLS_D]|nr:MAG: ribonuclease H [delta proteobacterium MLS_D]